MTSRRHVFAKVHGNKVFRRGFHSANGDIHSVCCSPVQAPGDGRNATHVVGGIQQPVPKR